MANNIWPEQDLMLVEPEQHHKLMLVFNETNGTSYSKGKLEFSNLIWFMQILSATVVLIMTVSTLIYFAIRKYNRQGNDENSKNWSTLNEINEESGNYNYGTCDDNKSSVYSYVESIDSNQPTRCFKITNSITWPTFNFLARVRNLSLRERLRHHLTTKSTRKFQTDDEISLKRFSPAAASSFSIDSASYNSLNSISTILSNGNLNLFNINQTKLINAAQLGYPSIILNYSLYFNERTKSLVISIISLENVHMPASLSAASNIELNIYVKIEILSSKEVTMMSMMLNGGSSVNSSQASLAPASTQTQTRLPKISAKTRLIRNKANPVYNETFELENLSFVYEQLNEPDSINDEINMYKCYRLVFNVCNSNLFGRDQIIGQTVHNLLREDYFVNSEYKKIMESDVDSGRMKDTTRQVNENVYSRIFSKKVDLVVETRLNDINLGQLHMSLVYNSAAQCIKIHILKGSNLKLPKHFLNYDKIPNSYVKIYMLYRGQRVDKKQTKVVEQSRVPVFDQIFEFNILSLLQLTQPLDNVCFDNSPGDAFSSLKEFACSQNLNAKIASRIQFIILVMDSDQIEKNDVIGKIALNTQHHQERLFTNQLQQGMNFKKDTIFENAATVQGGLDTRMPRNNWFDIFYKPDFPILCTFQINSY